MRPDSGRGLVLTAASGVTHALDPFVKASLLTVRAEKEAITDSGLLAGAAADAVKATFATPAARTSIATD